MNMQMLGKLEGFTAVSATHTTEKGGLNGETVITMTKYVLERHVAHVAGPRLSTAIRVLFMKRSGVLSSMPKYP